jgi:hypothetical protein
MLYSDRVLDPLTDGLGKLFYDAGLKKGNLDGRSEQNKKNKNPDDEPEYPFDHRIFNKFES